MFTFPVINLESWRSRSAQLLELAPTNPFAVVVLAQLEANVNHPDSLRLVRKKELVRRLYDWGFSRDHIVALRRERQQGLKEVLTAQISQKFGELPEWAEARMAGADKTTLNRWALQILDAQRIEDVFA